MNQLRTVALGAVFFTLTISTHAQGVRTNCWFTTYAGQYARIYTNSTMEFAGKSLTNWSNGTESQSPAAYCGVQEVYSSTNWVYVLSTGLASYTMGPWYLNAAHTTEFPNFPVDQKVLFRFPVTNAVPVTKTENGGGQIGVFVDGVAMYNSWDAYTWDVASNADEQNVTGYWNRDAYVNEGVTFDSGYAHQQGTGVYHYHADPIALRYLLGDHVQYNATSNTYNEETNITPTVHSPILAWTADGFPLYGPYGYSIATNANSGIRRMVTGYVIRNGQDGTSNLTAYGRTTIPQWEVRLDNNIASNQPGPNVSVSYPLGRYMEDNDYLGDLINPNTGTNFQQGTDFDLDQYNGRWCVTPDFPNGTYAYFVAIDSNGTPVFPYNIGRGFYGSPVGGSVVAITEPVTTNFLGYTNLSSTLNVPSVASSHVTLTWSAVEGGSYEVLMSTNLTNSSFSTVVSGVLPIEIKGANTNTASYSQQFYRVGRTAVATFDDAGPTIFATNGVAPGGAANPGQNVLMTITLTSTPPNPPVNASSPTVFLTNTTTHVAIIAVNVSRPATNMVDALFEIPSNAPTNTENVVVSFSPMPVYTLNGYFIVN